MRQDNGPIPLKRLKYFFHLAPFSMKKLGFGAVHPARFVHIHLDDGKPTAAHRAGTVGTGFVTLPKRPMGRYFALQDTGELTSVSKAVGGIYER